MMNKLKFLPGLCLYVLINILNTPAFSQTRPNILWITIEDTSPHFIGSYGNENASTPNIDKLSDAGVRFINAFSTGTVCSPSRTTLITGVRTYENGTGNHRSEIPVPAYMHGFPYYMQQAGYYTSNNAKTDYNIVKEKEYIANAWNESSDEAGWWKRKPGQPFFAVYNFMDSHQSRTMTSPYANYKKMVLDNLPEADRIGENDFEMPPIYRDSPEMRKQFARVYNALKLTDNKIGVLLQKLEKDHLTDSTIIFFYGDHGEGIPRGKTNGINLGYRVPFAIWFPPMYKHLSPWGQGLVTEELIDFEDLAPTLISIAGGRVPEYMKGRILFGANRSKAVDHLELSSDRSDNGIDMIRSITDGKFMYSRNYMPFMPEARFINYMEIGEIKKIMRKDLADNKLNPLQKSLFEPRPGEFLFDTEKDVWETTNLASKPEYRAQLKKMRKQLNNAVIKSRDILFLPEYEVVQISKSTNPYEYRLKDADYPIREIYKAASLAGMRGKNTTAQQVKLLQSKNKIIRYWAVLGLRSQSDEHLKPYKQQILQVINDTFPPASVTASAIGYDVFGDKVSSEKLKKFITGENKEIAMLAMNYLLYVKNKQPFVETVKAASVGKKVNGDVNWAFSDFLGNWD